METAVGPFYFLPGVGRRSTWCGLVEKQLGRVTVADPIPFFAGTLSGIRTNIVGHKRIWCEMKAKQ